VRFVFEWFVPLSQPPSREWEARFRQTVDFTPVYHPNHVRIERGGLLFEADAMDVAMWLEYIDRWIASANDGAARGPAGLAVAPPARPRAAARG
jgi:hypothetical protein